MNDQYDYPKYTAPIFDPYGSPSLQPFGAGIEEAEADAAREARKLGLWLRRPLNASTENLRWSDV